MAYPELLYKGQYTLKRVLTMPMDPSLTKDDIGKFVTLNATGAVILAPADAGFFGVLRTVNLNDNICTVDFSGVHNFEASAALAPGDAVIPNSSTQVKKAAGGEVTSCVALTAAASGENVPVFFLI